MRQTVLLAAPAHCVDRNLLCSGAGAGEPREEDLPDFVSSERFTGRRPGYVFTTGKLGTGFYRDAAGGSGRGGGTRSKRKRPQDPTGEVARDKSGEPQRPALAADMAGGKNSAASSSKKKDKKAARALQPSRRGGILGLPKTALLAGDVGGASSSEDDEAPQHARVRSAV